MRDGPLNGALVLIVEDEAVIALDLKCTLEEAGAVVIGPARTLRAAQALAQNDAIAVALLDVQIGEQRVFPIARLLADRGIPFAFHTACAEHDGLTSEWPSAPVLTKPASQPAIVKTIARLLER